MRGRIYEGTLGVVIMALLQVGCSVFGVRKEENPKYRVILQEGDKEIREYEPYIVASTKIEGSFKEAQNPGFRVLATYIFGENEGNQKISMTAPVVQRPEKIAMTAPVVQSPSGGGWEMTFMMPSKYKLEDLPLPKDPRVKLKVMPARTLAVIRFSGFWSDEKNRKMAGDLQDWLTQLNKYESVSAPMFAGYDPPWTLPLLRRNEMMIEVRTTEFIRPGPTEPPARD